MSVLSEQKLNFLTCCPQPEYSFHRQISSRRVYVVQQFYRGFKNEGSYSTLNIDLTADKSTSAVIYNYTNTRTFPIQVETKDTGLIPDLDDHKGTGTRTATYQYNTQCNFSGTTENVGHTSSYYVPSNCYGYTFNSFSVASDSSRVANGNDETGGVTLSNPISGDAILAALETAKESAAWDDPYFGGTGSGTEGGSIYPLIYLTPNGEAYAVTSDDYRFRVGYKRENSEDNEAGLEWLEVEYEIVYRRYPTNEETVLVTDSITWTGSGDELSDEEDNWSEWVILPTPDIYGNMSSAERSELIGSRTLVRFLKYKTHSRGHWIIVNEPTPT